MVVVRAVVEEECVSDERRKREKIEREMKKKINAERAGWRAIAGTGVSSGTGRSGAFKLNAVRRKDWQCLPQAPCEPRDE